MTIDTAHRYSRVCTTNRGRPKMSAAEHTEPVPEPVPVAFVTAISGLDEHGNGFVHIEVGPSEAWLSCDQAVAHAQHVLEAAAVAEVESAMFNWLVKDASGPDAESIANALRIVRSFRQFRAEAQLAVASLESREPTDG